MYIPSTHVVMCRIKSTSGPSNCTTTKQQSLSYLHASIIHLYIFLNTHHLVHTVVQQYLSNPVHTHQHCLPYLISCIWKKKKRTEIVHAEVLLVVLVCSAGVSSVLHTKCSSEAESLYVFGNPPAPCDCCPTRNSEGWECCTGPLDPLV